MNDCVLNFEMEDDISIPGLSRQKKFTLPEDEFVELLWQNGQVVMHSQNQRYLKKSPPKSCIEDAVIPAGKSTGWEISSSGAAEEEEEANQLFMQEDEMASWLHYPLDDSFERDLYADLLYHTPSTNYAPPGRSNQMSENLRTEDKPPVISRPPIPPVRQTELDSSSKFHNLTNFSRQKSNSESGPSTSAAGKSTVVNSRETPSVAPESRVSHGRRSTVSGGNFGRGSMGGDAAAADGSRESVTCDPAGTSSSGASASASAPPAEDRKRKTRDADDSECYSEDVEFKSANAKKHVRGSTSARRARAAEVHNLSERRRRDRINEKMKALQELIPHCNKSDKASMLDEAIEYLKSLQLQVQMMSMGRSMVPMMFPGVQQYMSPMGMGMGMRMGMDMGFSRPMLPFSSVLGGPVMPTPPAASHLGPKLPMPAFHLTPVPTADPSRIQATNHSNPELNSIGMQNPNQLQVPNFADPYQHYLALHQMQALPPQNQAMAQPKTSKGVASLENHQSG